MIILDTDIVSLIASGNPKVVQQARAATEPLAISIVTRIEILRARFDYLAKAADGEQLQRAQYWLDQSESDLRKLPTVSITAAVAKRFDHLRQQKGLKKIGRADLLIAGIALANDATLVTRNLRHFRQIPNLRIENWAD